MKLITKVRKNIRKIILFLLFSAIYKSDVNHVNFSKYIDILKMIKI